MKLVKSVNMERFSVSLYEVDNRGAYRVEVFRSHEQESINTETSDLTLALLFFDNALIALEGN